MAGTPVGFRMQTPDSKGVQVVDMQPKGNLPLLKPDDIQYFDKLLVSVEQIVWNGAKTCTRLFSEGVVI